MYGGRVLLDAVSVLTAHAVRQDRACMGCAHLSAPAAPHMSACSCHFCVLPAHNATTQLDVAHLFLKDSACSTFWQHDELLLCMRPHWLLICRHALQRLYCVGL